MPAGARGLGVPVVDATGWTRHTALMPLDVPTSGTRLPARPTRGVAATAGLLAAAWVALCLVVVGLGRLLTHPLAGSLGAAENDLARWVAGQRTPALGVVAEIGTFLGNTITGLVLLALLAAGFSLWQRSWRPAAFVAVVTVGNFGLYLVATHLDPRQRPPVRILDPGLVPDHSFPSGHSATATAVVGCALVLTWWFARSAHRWLLLLLAVPVLTALSRLYQGAHHVTDVLTGLAMASVWVATAALLLRPGPAPARDGGRQ